MRQCEVAEIIKAPPSAVWSRLAAVCEWPGWLPTVTAVNPLSEPQLAIGRRYHIVQPRLRPAIWTVTELIPGESFAWESKSIGVTVAAQHIVSDLGAEGSRIVLRVAFEGLLAPVAFFLGRRLTSQYIRREAEAIRAVVERAHSAV